MEDKILNALNNISNAIEEIAKHTKAKSKESAKNLLQSVDLGKKMDDIKNNIKNIKKDTEKILQNQQTLMQLSKEKSSKTSLFETASDKAGKIKNGVNTVLLIAAGVLAIGLAFKLIGQVDFLSVIALSIALPLVAIAFERIANLKGLKGADLKSIFYSVVTMSTAVMVASWILSLVRPISISQSLTAILIAGTFALLGHSVERIANGIKNIRPKDLLLMPLVLFTMSLSITMASQVLRGIHPISFAQGLTAILIAGTFAIVSYSIDKIANGLKNIKPSDVIKMPLVLVTFAISITAASWVMRLITPISFSQGLTAIALAATLAIVSLSLPALAYAVSKTSLAEAAKMVAILPLLALSIAISSWALQLVVPVKELGSIVLLSIAIGVSSLAMAGTMWAISRMGLTLVDILKGGLAIVGLATTMAISSWILSAGNYTKFPTLEWAAGVGLSLVAFGLSAIVLGAIASTGVGAIALLAGAASILGLAGVVVATSYILAAGKYESYPSVAWSSGVALSLATFGAGTLLLGTMIVGTLGLGLIALAAGASAVLVISQSIVDSSNILSKGSYNSGPTKEWAEGISLALGAFAPIFKTIFDKGLLSIFSSGPSAKDFADAITTISNGIVTAGMYFSNVPNIWKGGPTSEWAAGVGGALGAFTPVFDALSKSSGLFGSGPTPKEMNEAMLNVARSIVDVGTLFNSAAGVWTKAPTAEWAAGVSGAISAFGPIFDFFEKNKDNGWFDNTFENLNDAILTVARSIVDVDKILSKGTYAGAIPAGYIQSMADNIRQYVELISYLQNQNVSAFSFIDTLSVTYGLSQLASGYEKLSKSIHLLGNSLNAIDMNKLNSIKSLTGNIVLLSLMDSEQFEKMMTAFENKGGIFIKLIEELDERAEKQRYGTISSVKSQTTNTNDTDSQILSTLRTIAKNTGEAAKYSKSLSELMEELRHNNNNSIKDKKHY
jgi:hypothetical protein